MAKPLGLNLANCQDEMFKRPASVLMKHADYGPCIRDFDPQGFDVFIRVTPAAYKWAMRHASTPAGPWAAIRYSAMGVLFTGYRPKQIT